MKRFSFIRSIVRLPKYWKAINILNKEGFVNSKNKNKVEEGAYWQILIYGHTTEYFVNLFKKLNPKESTAK